MSKSEAEQLLLGGRGRWREADESSRGGWEDEEEERGRGLRVEW